MPNPLKTYTLGKDPHVWAIADFSYRAMMDEFQKYRSVRYRERRVGRGKDLRCKCVMNYLTKLSERQTKLVEDQKGRRTSITKTGIEDKIMACNPFLEAFGNARQSDNSSRFRKVHKILYHGGNNGCCNGRLFVGKGPCHGTARW